MVRLCLEIEESLGYRSGSVRDDVTGPLVDALHAETGILRKRLKSGVAFDFRYTSKIAREFVMSRPETPDHVWEPQTTKLLVYLSHKAQQAVVGGAYFGDQAVLVAREMASHGGVCHAFEPNADNFEMLSRNAELNGLRNLRTFQLGLWDEDGARLQFVGQDALAGSVAATGEVGEAAFSATTVDAYLAREGIEEVQLVALDLEGGEFRALRGAKRQLSLPAARAPNVVFEVHRSYTDWSNGLQNTHILSYLSSLGYHAFAVRDFQANYDMGERPIELVLPEKTYLEGPQHGFNMVAVKDVSILKNDRFRFCEGVSPKLLLHKDPALHHPVGGF